MRRRWRAASSVTAARRVAMPVHARWRRYWAYRRSFDRSRGEHKAPQVALIVEADCIGCTKCIQACPVDAIVGGAKYMHTVIADLCTGCELCIPPCPVDCIELVPSHL
jgi:RnfABCDGE-type electron transport complex B subunit